MGRLSGVSGELGLHDVASLAAKLIGVHVLNGAIYGLASHGRFLGAFKPGNRSPDVRGLYLAGGAAHPGPGMPMVLMSGWIAADSLDQDAGRPSNENVRVPQEKKLAR